MTQIPLLTPEQFDSLDLSSVPVVLSATKLAMDIIGQVTPMLWIEIGPHEAHIPATLFRAFTLKCQQYVLVPEFPALATERLAEFQLIKYYFEIVVKYALRQPKVTHLVKALLTQQQESQIEVFKLPQDAFQRFQQGARLQTKKAFLSLFKQEEDHAYPELSFFTEMRAMLKSCSNELKTTVRVADGCAKMRELKANRVENSTIQAYLNEYHRKWQRLCAFTIPTLEIAINMLTKAEFWINFVNDLYEKQLSDLDNQELKDRITQIEDNLNYSYVIIKRFRDDEVEQTIRYGYEATKEESAAEDLLPHENDKQDDAPAQQVEQKDYE